MSRADLKGVKKVIATEEQVKSIRLELTAEKHKEFRIQVARNGTTMSAMARRLVEEWIDKEVEAETKLRRRSGK